MLQEEILLILSLLFAVFMLVMLGQKLRISYPIFLVIGGLLISFIPSVPAFSISPDLIFLIFLPPLLYEAAWYTSWADFWKWKRPIGLLGFGLVIFTSCIIAFVSSSFIPGFTLALGFLLGGIISPPDAVAATSILKSVKVPKRALIILQGESLVNDASSLIVFRFALAAVISGTFVFEKAATEFFVVTLMGIVVGLIVAHFFYVVHRWLPTSPSIDTALTFMGPYFMYIGAEHFHYSGVMAVVSGGLFLSFRSHEFFGYRSRLQSQSVWKTVAFVLNGLVFILIGLQLPVIVDGLGNYSLFEALKYGLLVSLVTVAIRILWMYPATYLPRMLSKHIRNNEEDPGWKGVFVVSWAGMRGVVSLASALAIPVTLSDGQPFPQRNLILFITFVVILVTLVFQGLTLPLILRWMKIKEVDSAIPDEEQEAGVRLRLMHAALTRLNDLYTKEMAENELVENLKAQLESTMALTSKKLESLESNEVDRNEVDEFNRVLHDIISAQRKELFLLRKEKFFDDEMLRHHEAQLDLDEARII
ncbi:Na+/H+ antiporter [Runella sp.]|uniref:Na+/H+ antiporter n=1 Tax=Runella sp. TaxID=1960881 RepID=UPI003D0DD983